MVVWLPAEEPGRTKLTPVRCGTGLDGCVVTPKGSHSLGTVHALMPIPASLLSRPEYRCADYIEKA